MPPSGSWPAADDLGVPAKELVAAIKHAIKVANMSAIYPDRDLVVTSVYIKLNTVATVKAGGQLDFRVPFIGLKVRLGGSLTQQNTHVMEMTLVPDSGPVIETRDALVEKVLVEAIETARVIMASAATGDDPFVLRESAVELTFGVMEDGSISLGFEGELSDEITHTLRVTIGPP